MVQLWLGEAVSGGVRLGATAAVTLRAIPVFYLIFIGFNAEPAFILDTPMASVVFVIYILCKASIVTKYSPHKYIKISLFKTMLSLRGFTTFSLFLHFWLNLASAMLLLL